MRKWVSQMENKKRFSISLTTQILIATAGGIVFGALVGEWASNLKFIGDIFIRLIQMSVVLLVMSAVASAVGGGDGQDGIPYIQMDHYLHSYFRWFRRSIVYVVTARYRS